DVPVRQVMIEARIVEMSSQAQENLGVKWGLAGRGSYDNGKVQTQVGPSISSLDSIRSAQTDGSSLSGTVGSDALSVDFGQGGGTSQIAFGFLKDNVLLDLELDALQSEGKSENISRPRVITSDKQAAHIESGAQIPFEQATSSGATSVTFASATLALDVTPQITPDDRILLDLSVTNDGDGGAASNGQPIIKTQRVKTKVLVNNGETLVLGGIYKLTDSVTKAKTPLLGDIPLIGHLFRATQNNGSKDEVMIFITPRLINDSVTGK
ncbi:MAG TPA: type IV pilus secretin PilQ, partial [Pseudomonadales bacterium]|nr:type IV pilus secretin PilQ [Pseudomonadales bacterium]